MGKYRIKCITHDKNEVITHVDIDNERYKVEKIVQLILDKAHSFYTEENDKRAEVYAKQHPTSKRWFLTTDPDSDEENNLDFLPKC